MMKTPEEIEKVFAAISKADPNREDEELEVMNDTLRFVMGYSEETAEEFISMYIEES